MVEGEEEVTSGGEGDHELRESRQERSKISIRLPPLPPPPPPPPPPPRTITNCVKRALPSATSKPPLPPLLKKTRYNPDLTLCHGCGLRFPSTNNNHSSRTRLRLLRSCWRVALLCKSCLSRIKSAELCSYCFHPVCESTVDCLSCSRRVHLECARGEQRCVVSGPLDPSNFTCIDCCVIPNPRGGSGSGGSSKCLSSVLLVERDAKPPLPKRGRVASKEKERTIAQHKVSTSEHAAENARSQLGGTLGVKKEASQSTDDGADVPDEQLALQLHLAMNGSRRISRSSCSLRSGRSSAKLDKGHELGSLEKVDACTDDSSFLESVDRNGFILALPVERQTSRRGRKKAIHKNGKDEPLDSIHKEDQGSCSDKLSLNSNGDDCSSSSILASHKMEKNTEVGAKSAELLGNISTGPDRYLKKYNKRNKKLSGLSNLKESELVHEEQICSSEASRTLTDVPNHVSVAERICSDGKETL